MLAGIALLVWWVVAVTDYGAEVDDRGLAPVFRPDHVALLVSSAACILTACLLPLFRRSRRWPPGGAHRLR
ncbi:hypothetical protein CW368_10365 [Actinomycetales bacterium SN12]|nr:hypothetical protein CW368_10365 [Actinomycetales bacterium SN12]